MGKGRNKGGGVSSYPIFLGDMMFSGCKDLLNGRQQPIVPQFLRKFSFCSVQF